MKLALVLILGYLIGSVPFALVIGKLFYQTDIRQFGSHNLGGGNAGRVLGAKAGLSVMALDILKVTLVVGLAVWFHGGKYAAALGGLAAAIGHCYPLFARFKGGKAVATMYGFLLGLVLFAGYSPWLFFLPMAVFLMVLYLTKIIALGSIISALAATLFAALMAHSLPVTLALCVFTVIIVVRHRANIGRILRHEENKIKWM